MSRGDLLAPLGVAAALVCCARLPAVVAFAGGLAVGNLLGAGLLVALVVGALAGRNRRRACSRCVWSWVRSPGGTAAAPVRPCV